MTRHSKVPQYVYWIWMQFIGNWATVKQIVLLITGKLTRLHSTETILPRMVKRGLLRRTKFQKGWAYAARRVTKGNSSDWNVEHGIGCTEGLVRFWISDRSGELIPERKFKGQNIWPEWAIRYPSGKILLYEFCTKDNSRRKGVVKSKITRYQAILREEFVIVFVMDIPRQDVVELVAQLQPEGNFMFTDYETFKSVPLGQQLTASIYLWGEDSQPHPLRNYERS